MNATEEQKRTLKLKLAELEFLAKELTQKYVRYMFQKDYETAADINHKICSLDNIMDKVKVGINMNIATQEDYINEFLLLLENNETLDAILRNSKI